jgi:hypothetical protein
MPEALGNDKPMDAKNRAGKYIWPSELMTSRSNLLEYAEEEGLDQLW